MSALGRIAVITRKELLQLRRDRMTIGMMVMLPLMQLLLFGQTTCRDGQFCFDDRVLSGSRLELIPHFIQSRGVGSGDLLGFAQFGRERGATCFTGCRLRLSEGKVSSGGVQFRQCPVCLILQLTFKTILCG